jgi:hypothetical protein
MYFRSTIYEGRWRSTYGERFGLRRDLDIDLDSLTKIIGMRAYPCRIGSGVEELAPCRRRVL